jgi:hypothetical protein
MSNQWLKERFGERGEGFGRDRCEEEISEETDERKRMHATTKEEYLVGTSEEVAGRSKPAMPEDVGLHPNINATLQMNVTPISKKFSLEENETNPESLIPPTPSTNLVISPMNIYVSYVNSNPSSPTSSSSSSSNSVAECFSYINIYCGSTRIYFLIVSQN